MQWWKRTPKKPFVDLIHRKSVYEFWLENGEYRIRYQTYEDGRKVNSWSFDFNKRFGSLGEAERWLAEYRKAPELVKEIVAFDSREKNAN